MSRPVPLGDLAAIMRHVSRELEREGHRFAVPIAQMARVMVEGARGDEGGCRGCGGPVESVRVGRPRVWCEGCHPPRRQTPTKGTV